MLRPNLLTLLIYADIMDTKHLLLKGCLEMAKIIEVRNDIISIGTDYNTIEEVRASDLNFVPHLGDEVEIFRTDTRTIVSRIERRNDFPAGGININMNQVQNNPQVQNQQQGVGPVYASGRVVNKLVYVLLAIFLGGIGGQKFYAGRWGLGILCLIFCWTGLPSVIGVIEGILVALRPSDPNGNLVL